MRGTGRYSDNRYSDSRYSDNRHSDVTYQWEHQYYYGINSPDDQDAELPLNLNDIF
jgi:hypothetical protein